MPLVELSKGLENGGKSETQRRGVECSELVLVVHSVPSCASNVAGSCLREIPNTREACASAGNPTQLWHLSFSFLLSPPLFLAEFDVCYSVLTTSRHINCISYLRPPLKKKVLNLASSASKFGMFA